MDFDCTQQRPECVDEARATRPRGVDEATWANASGVMDEIRRKFGGDAIRTVAALRDVEDLGEIGENPWGPASSSDDTR